jgi:hypothetical protein
MADAQPTFRIVLYVVVGVGMIGAGALRGSQARADRSVELSMAAMVDSNAVVGKLEAPRPPFSDQAARQLMVGVGIVLIVVRIGLLVGSVVSPST